ncbi:transporter [Rhizobium pusense]|uniref:SphA family protein n=1 Tax=Agrobacterium pusense TaxID=648995 RepID=UPI001FCDEF66|nr:transporter [Agrobacterium pusense]MCJ2877410.1 transporter [Agrobacterium pusense]
MRRIKHKSVWALVLLASLAGGKGEAAEFMQTSTPGGTTDIRAAELPPEPGLYLIGGLVGVNRDRLNDGDGNELFPDTEARLRIGSIGGIYVYPGEFLGGRMASSLIFSYGQNKTTITNTTPADLSSNRIGLFDPYTDLFFWSKSWYEGPPPGAPGQQPPSADFIPPMPVGFTLGLGLGATIPLGIFDNKEVGNPGFHNWVISPNIAVTYRTKPILLDATEFSARLWYNHNFEREDSTGGFTYRDGDYLSMDFAVTERYQRYQFGLAGNVKWQVQDDEGTPATPALDGQRHKSIQLGPILAVDFPEYRSTISLKYMTDVYSRNAFVGDYLLLSFSKKIF